MHYLVPVALVAVAIIHLLPLAGILGSARLSRLYGIAVAEPNVELLLRHRAVLFGIIGLLLLAAVFLPALQPVALLVGGSSVVSFLLLAWLVGPINTQLSRVVAVDILALFLLVGASLVHLFIQSAA
jgi:hypothetical protein